MKILVTGGNGFIARNLAETSWVGKISKIADRKELDLLDTGKVNDYLKDGSFDVIIHTATYDAAPKHSTKDPNKVLENNLRMFFNIARCEKYFGKLIYFGSGAEYDREHWLPRMDEDYFDRHIPTDQYGFSKYLMTKYAMQNKKVYNLRLFGVFGKYDDWRTRVIPNICCLAMAGRQIKIIQNKFYDFIDIADLVKIVRWFVENDTNKNIVNVCTGKTISFVEIAEKIIKISKKKLSITIENEGLGKEYSGDNSRLVDLLGGFKFTPIDDSLKYLYDWFIKNKQDIDV